MGSMWRYVISICIIVGVAFGGMWAHAQVAQSQPPTIISGADLGFRVERYKGNTPVGRLVVRINGQWVEAEDAIVLKRLTSR